MAEDIVTTATTGSNQNSLRSLWSTIMSFPWNGQLKQQTTKNWSHVMVESESDSVPKFSIFRSYIRRRNSVGASVFGPRDDNLRVKLLGEQKKIDVHPVKLLKASAVCLVSRIQISCSNQFDLHKRLMKIHFFTGQEMLLIMAIFFRADADECDHQESRYK
ncbi:hypothetical protein HUJ04_010962 [Dendroctonus ponderosae]|nr:hypothetical protein HUJ04_010962 [Dendroctonus ponderosae]